MKSAFTRCKLKDLDELQDVVAAHAEALEAGLEVKATRARLGETTIDLVGIDGEGRLVLIALGFDAGDEMLLRALDAFASCLESPDIVRRLSPGARVSPAQPPRVVFVAERIPDAFLRKIRHVKFPRVDCVEFRFGLQFSAVDGPRETAAAARGPAPAAEGPAERLMVEPDPAPEPRRLPERRRVEPPRGTDVLDRSAAAPRGPDAGRAAASPAPGRPALRDEDVERAAGATNGHAAGRRRETREDSAPGDSRSVKTVREYLQREFPTTVIYDFHAHDRAAQMFHLQDSYGGVVHSVAVAEEFLQSHGESEIRAFLDTHKLARVLRQAGQAGVSVTPTGVKIDAV